MTQQIKLKRNTTNTTAPTTSDIDVGELAISAVDGKIYLRKTNDDIVDPVNVAASENHTHTEEIQDVVGAMFTGNTETNVTVTYQDGDGTIDVVGLTQPNTILRVVARSGHIDCDVTDATLPVTARSGTVTVRKVSLPVQVIPQVTYR